MEPKTFIFNFFSIHGGNYRKAVDEYATVIGVEKCCGAIQAIIREQKFDIPASSNRGCMIMMSSKEISPRCRVIAEDNGISFVLVNYRDNEMYDEDYEDISDYLETFKGYEFL
jgi:hypothetical protein